MKSQLIFQEAKELERLAVQNRLLFPQEQVVFSQILGRGEDLKVLDIGCNGGQKTVRYFDVPSVGRVIGLEFNEALARQAQEEYGNGKFTFCCMDVEGEAFPQQLAALLEDCGIRQLDVIYLSFLLMHLRDPEKLLAALEAFLKPGGQLVIVEPNDGASALTPDGDGSLEQYLDILDRDPYSGNRRLGGQLIPMLTRCGYCQIREWLRGVEGGPGETARKRDIFTTFFSYLPEDVQILRALEPQNAECRRWEAWLEREYPSLQSRILGEKSRIFMGVEIVTCEKAGTAQDPHKEVF